MSFLTPLWPLTHTPTLFSLGKKLDRSVVQRIQRFGQGGIFKRTVLQAIAAELLSLPGSGTSCRMPPQQQRDSDDDDFDDLDDADDARVDMTASGGFRPVVMTPNTEALEALYSKLDLGQQESVGTEQLAGRLRAMGE